MLYKVNNNNNKIMGGLMFQSCTQATRDAVVEGYGLILTTWISLIWTEIMQHMAFLHLDSVEKCSRCGQDIQSSDLGLSNWTTQQLGHCGGY